MKRIMVVRHAMKGDGKNAPKNHLSPQGEVDARELGKNLPESMKGAPIDYVGGSVHSRSLHTALLIALGAGHDPLILPSRIELGSEEQFWQMTTLEEYNEAIAKHNGNMMLAVKEIFSQDACDMIREGMIAVLWEASLLGDRVILGTHNPWLQFLFEALTEAEYNVNAPELSYIVINVADENGEFSIIDTSLPL